MTNKTFLDVAQHLHHVEAPSTHRIPSEHKVIDETLLDAAQHLHHVEEEEVRNTSHEEIDAELVDIAEHLKHVDRQSGAAPDTAVDPVDSALNDAIRRSVVQIDALTEQLREAEIEFRQSQVRVSRLSMAAAGAAPGGWDATGGAWQDGGSALAASEALDTASQSPRTAAKREAAAVKLEAAARGRGSRKQLVVLKRKARAAKAAKAIFGGGDDDDEAAPGATGGMDAQAANVQSAPAPSAPPQSAEQSAAQAEAERLQELAREKLEAAQAAVKQAHERLMKIKKQQDALRSKRKSVGTEEYARVQAALQKEAERRRLQEEERQRKEAEREAERQAARQAALEAEEAAAAALQASKGGGGKARKGFGRASVAKNAMGIIGAMKGGETNRENTRRGGGAKRGSSWALSAEGAGAMLSFRSMSRTRTGSSKSKGADDNGRNTVTPEGQTMESLDEEAELDEEGDRKLDQQFHS